MSRNFDSYADDDESSGNSDDDSDNFDNDDEMTMLITPYAELEVTFDEVFGTDTAWGHQSLGVKVTDIDLVNGCLYYDAEKDKYKVFSWEEVVGIPASDDRFDADEASEFLVKTYGSTKKRYELKAAVDPENDDPEPIGDAIMWYGGSDDYGPKSASKVLAQLLTEEGRDMVIRDDDGNVDDIENWLTVTDTENQLRNDLAGRRFAFFEIEKDSNESDRQFQHPIVEDVKTEKQITVNTDDSGSQATVDESTDEAAATDGGTSRREELEAMSYSELQSVGSEVDGASGNGTSEEIVDSVLEAEDGIPAAENDEGVPEPVNDFVQSVGQFDDFSEDRASDLLTDFVGDDELPLTQDLVDNFGGEDAVLAEAGY